MTSMGPDHVLLLFILAIIAVFAACAHLDEADAHRKRLSTLVDGLPDIVGVRREDAVVLLHGLFARDPACYGAQIEDDSEGIVLRFPQDVGRDVLVAFLLGGLIRITTRARSRIYINERITDGELIAIVIALVRRGGVGQ